MDYLTVAGKYSGHISSENELNPNVPKAIREWKIHGIVYGKKDNSSMEVTVILEYFSNLHPIYQALIATLFTWFMTALGSGLVFFFKSINRKILDAMLVMIAASY